MFIPSDGSQTSLGNNIYWDVILDYHGFKKAKSDLKKIILANAIIDSFDILDGYNKFGINKVGLKEDVRSFFTP